MAMSPTLEELFNRQITLELSSSVSYLQMSAYLEGQGLVGMASWMRIQSDEERAHALRFLDFLLDREGKPIIGAIDAPVAAFDSPTGVFRAALSQERSVTSSISDLYRAADAEGEVLALPLLQAFLGEQVEEEASVSEILDRLGLAGGDGAALLDIDRELGSRQP